MAKFEILVMGCGRGGTTLLSSILDAHPNLEVESEYRSKEILMSPGIGVKKLDEFLQACSRRAEQRNLETMWGNKITTEQLRGLTDSFDFKTKQWSAEGAFGAAGLRMIDKLAEAIPKILFIVRDGRACIASQIKRGFSWQLASRNWQYSLCVLNRLRDHNCHVVRFEDLVLYPDVVLNQVCRFVDVEYHTDMLKGAIRPGKGYYKYEGFIVSKVQPDKVLPLECLETVKVDLEKHGYPTTQ